LVPECCDAGGCSAVREVVGVDMSSIRIDYMDEVYSGTR
jgi:hypothetical protein